MKERLESLTTEEIQRITDNIKLVQFDHFNYYDEHYCPLAIALNLHNTIEKPTDPKIKKELSKRFSPVNIMKGEVGKFYTRNRRDDLLSLCKEIIKTRK